MLTDLHRHLGTSGDGNKVKTSSIEGLLFFIQSIVPSAPIGLQYFVSRITPTVTSGDQSYTGVGFQPKNLIMFGLARDSFTPALANYFTFGFSDGTNNYCFSKNGDEQITGKVKDQSIRNYILSNGWDSNHYVRATLKSFDSDGFTLTWEILNNPADGASVTNDRYIYLAIG